MTAPHTNLTSIGLQIGDKLDKFEVVEQIGAGGMSVVWKGYDRLLDQAVAIKQLVLDAGVDEDAFRERFRREAAVQKQLSQANQSLVRIIEFIEDPRGLFIVMEYVQGPSLEHLLSQNAGPVDPKAALGIAAAAAVAMGAIHAQGVIHRDLKPANILLPAAGGLKICDFGLASLVAGQETPAVGTVRYMAPELLNAQPGDARADIYALGMILYEMLIGRQNFEDAFKIVLRDQRNQALRWMKWHTNLKVKAPPIKQYVPAMPDAVGQLVDRMMEKDAGQRIASADQLIDAMRRQLTGQAPPALAAAKATKGPAGDKTASLPKRNKLLYVVTGMVIFWSLAGIGYALLTSRKKADVQDARVAVVHGDYRSAVKLFRGADYKGAADAFRSVLQTHEKYHQLKVPGADNKPHALLDAAQAHLTFTEAFDAFGRKDYNAALPLLDKVRSTGVVDQNLIAAMIDDTLKFKSVADLKDKIMAEVNRENYFSAKAIWMEFHASPTYKSLAAAEQRAFDDLELVIRAQRESKEAGKVLKEAADLAAVDRQKAIEHLSLWLDKHRDNPNRTVMAARDAYVAANEFELTIARGKAAEQREEWAVAIEAYNQAMGLNRLEAEKQDLPSRIRRIRGVVLQTEAQTAFDGGNMTLAADKATAALREDPALTQPRRILESIGNAEQLEAAKRQAVAAAVNKEFEKAIDFWKKAGDLGMNPADVAAEVAKLDFQILVNVMEAAWSGGDEQAILDACDRVLRTDSSYDRATLLKTLVTTRRRFREQLASAESATSKGQYGDAKLAIRRARDIAETVADNLIKDQLVREANRLLSDVEYLDNFNKALRDYENGRFPTALGSVIGALNEKKTDEAISLRKKIEDALAKEKREKGL